MCIHKYIRVEDCNHESCGDCFVTPKRMSVDFLLKYPKGYCPHSFKVCKECGKAVGYGSHGKLTIIPDSCLAQIEKMASGEF